MIDAAIIIPHYNDVVRLGRCLAALLPQIGPDVELVVVDNGSIAPLDPIRAAYPAVRIVTEPLKGAACARNRGVAETTALRLFFLDCDCVPGPDWLSTALQVSDNGDLVGGAVQVFDETPPPRNGAQAFEAVFAFDNQTYVTRKGFSVTANLLTRRDVFTDVGNFIPGLSEDLDWCRRARTKGYGLIYAPGLVVAHPSRGDWVALRGKWRRLTQEAFGVNGGGRLARVRWAAKVLVMPISIAAHAPRVWQSDRLADWTERRAALTTLVRLRLTRAWWMARQVIGLPI